MAKKTTVKSKKKKEKKVLKKAVVKVSKKKEKKVSVKIEELKEKGLTLQQETFCQLFASDREFFGNGTQSYIEAYDVDLSKKGAYLNAKAAAHENLTKPYLLKRINELLELRGLNDTFVDKQLELVITQNAEFPSKIAAIKEYNKLKKRTVDRVELDINRPFKDLTDEELQEALVEATKMLKKK